jgi:NAD(P)-dependent dehydrogenase (short-subunit alcohol dehydrogenase family)
LVRELGSQHTALALDVSDISACEKALADIQKSTPRLDRAIFMAALYEPTRIADITPDQFRRMVDVNLMGAFHIVNTVLPWMRQHQKGQIALCGSVAGYRGLPKGQPYSATKAALINFTESLRAEEKSHGLDIKLISPGFVKTPLTDKNSFDMPMIIEADTAAQEILKGLQSSRFEVAFPRLFACLMKMLRLLPYGIYFSVTRRMI